MNEDIAIHWFRQDLRICDNPSINYLESKYNKIIGIFIHDELNCDRNYGLASKNW